MKSLKSDKPPQSPTRAVALLATGTAAGQAILLLSAPILTRLYSPEQFGLLGLYVAIVSIAGTISTLRYELVIPLPKRDRAAANVLALTLLCVAGSTAMSVVVLSLGLDHLARWTDPRLRDVSWLVPLGVLAIGSYTALSHWAIRQRNFSRIARTKFVQAVSQTGIQIAGPFASLATISLPIGQAIGQAAGVGALTRDLLKRDRAALRGVSWRRIAQLGYRYRAFPIYSIWGAIAYAATLHAPMLVLIYCFDVATSGFYLLAQRLGAMPVTLVSDAVSQAIYRNLADAKNYGKVGQVLMPLIELTMTLTIGAAIAAAFVAPAVTQLILGQAWSETGLYLRWMAPWLAATLIFGSMTPVGSVMGWQKLTLSFQVLSLLVSIVGMILAAPYGPLAAIIAFAGLKAATIIVYRLYMLHALSVPIAALTAAGVLQTLAFLMLGWLAFQTTGASDLPPAYRWILTMAIASIALLLYAYLSLCSYRKFKAHYARHE